MRRLALPAALAAVALAGLAAPAQAAPAPAVPMVGVILPEQVAVIAGQTKTIRAEVFNAGTAPAKNVVVTFADVDKSLALTLPAGCDATSCPVGDLAPHASKFLTLKIAVTGDKLASTFEVSTGGFETEVAVVRSAGGVDLEIDPIGNLKLGRGESSRLPVVVHNTGTKAVDSVGVVVLGEPGLTALGNYRNCLGLDELSEEEDLGNGIICSFDETFEPGATFKVTNPLSIKVDRDAGGPYTYSAAVLAVGISDGDAALLAKKKSGKVLALDAARANSDSAADEPEDINPEDNGAFFGVTVGKSVADTAALGVSARGGEGDRLTVEVGMLNKGPTTLIPGSEDFTWVPSVGVTVPATLALTEVDPNCVPGAGAAEWDFLTAGTVDGLVYTCFAEYGGALVGESVKFAFVGTVTGSSSGTVVVDGGVQDTNKANNKAAIVLTASSGGSGGGLPVTGSPTGWLAGGGAFLLLAGAAVAFVFRRRGVATTL